VRITLDFTSALGDRTGVGTYTRELVRALLARTDLRLAVHTCRRPGWHGRMERLLLGAPRRWEARPNRLVPHGLLLEAERLAGLPPAEAVFGATDVFHGTNFLAPPCRRAHAVITVHDLAFLSHPDEAPVEHHYERYVRAAADRAARVIAVSEATRRDVIDLLGVPPERVHVVPEGAPRELPALPPTEFGAFLRRLGIPDRYLLFVGTVEPRKNLARLVRAYVRAADDLPGGTALVLAGRPGWHMAGTLAAVRKARRSRPVILTGFVPERVRNSLLAGALAFVYPSLHEGFGLPVLEAFAAGTPVLTADSSALPEVAGDAAIAVDPRDEAAIRDGLIRIAGDEPLRHSLAERGRARARLFTWDRAAEETLRVYEAAMDD